MFYKKVYAHQTSPQIIAKNSALGAHFASSKGLTTEDRKAKGQRTAQARRGLWKFCPKLYKICDLFDFGEKNERLCYDAKTIQITKFCKGIIWAGARGTTCLL